ncbi:MAG: DMT family transporter [Phycisphaerae bacterium]
MVDRDAARSFGLTLLLVGVTAIWGWTFTVVRDAVAAYGVLGFLAIRFAVATAVLVPLSLRRLNRRTLLAGLAIGLVLGVAYFFQTLGLKYTTPTNSGIVTGLFIIFVPFFDRILHGIRVRRLLWLAVAASLAGMALLVGDSPKQLRTGDMLTVVAAAAYGLHVSLLSRHSRRHDPGALAMGQMLTVALGAAMAWPFFEPVRLPPAEVWWAVAATGVLASALAFYIQTFVQRRLSALRTGIIITTEPLFAAMFGYLLAGDRLTAVQLAGAALLMCAIMISEIVPALQKTRRTASEDEQSVVAR